MKARVNTSSNSRNKSGIILSIGMIVKNEEKFLLNCLECLKPLMESVKSELVIVDTGSTDKTVEIAKKYTDKVYHFEWIHDFAAARNFGLEKCSGEWFMFLDADEHFADVEELIAFFNNKKLRDEYNTGTYLIRSFQHEYNSGTYVRNFQQQKENRYTAIAGIRIAKRYEGFGFEGAVHEIFKKVYAPIYHFKSYVNHYGYLYETEEDEKAKRQRNLVLLEKELEKKPDDIRVLAHAYDVFELSDERKSKAIEKMLELAKTETNRISWITAYIRAIEQYNYTGEYDNLHKILDEAIERSDADDAVLIEYYGHRGVVYFKDKKFNEAKDAFNKYIEYYKRYKAGELDEYVFSCIDSQFTGIEDYNAVIGFLSDCCINQLKYIEALDAYGNVDFKNTSVGNFREIAQSMVSVVAPPVTSGLLSDGEKESLYQKLIELYAKIVETNQPEKIDFFEHGLEQLYYITNDFANAFAENKCLSKENKFSQLMQICAKDGSGLTEFLKDGKLSLSHSPAIYFALKYDVDLTPVIEQLDNEQITEHIQKLVTVYNDIIMYVSNYQRQNEDYYLSSVKHLSFAVILFEAVVIKESETSVKNSMVDDARRFAINWIYDNISKYTSLLVANFYNADLLNPDDISILPEIHRFGYYMNNAQIALENGNAQGYIRELKAGLDSCSSMSQAIKYYITQYKAIIA